MHSIRGPYPDYNRYAQPRIKDIDKVEVEDITEPLTLAQIKAHLKVDSTDEDDYITDLIVACRQALEEYCAISIVGKEIIVTADWGGEWELPYGPVQDVTEVQYKSNNTHENWTVDENYFVDGSLFKTFRASGCERVQITYTAGYETVPKDLLLDLRRIVAYCYEHRGDEALTSLQGGMERPKSLDDALETFAFKHRRLLWL